MFPKTALLKGRKNVKSSEKLNIFLFEKSFRLMYMHAYYVYCTVFFKDKEN
jgi:hypothetical protein